MIEVSDLDTKISDYYSEQGKVGVKNTQTFREFIRESEQMLEIYKADIDNVTDEELDRYTNWLDDMWGK